jgi:hypothetical protein
LLRCNASIMGDDGESMFFPLTAPDGELTYLMIVMALWGSWASACVDE